MDLKAASQYLKESKLTTQNAVNTTLAGQSGTGAFCGTLSPTIMTPNIIGTATNNNAAAGSVGEYIESIISSPESILSGVNFNITSISLSPGDWDTWGQVVMALDAMTTINYVVTGISTTSLTLPSVEGYRGGWAFDAAGTTPYQADLFFMPPQIRLSLASTTTVYLVIQAVFNVSTATCMGFIGARRRR